MLSSSSPPFTAGMLRSLLAGVCRCALPAMAVGGLALVLPGAEVLAGHGAGLLLPLCWLPSAACWSSGKLQPAAALLAAGLCLVLYAGWLAADGVETKPPKYSSMWSR